MNDVHGHDPAFWSGRRVLVTGHTGFKGSWLSCYLVELGAEVMGVSLPGSASDPSLWDALALTSVHDLRADVAGSDWQRQATDFAPDVVIHAAAVVTKSIRKAGTYGGHPAEDSRSWAQHMASLRHVHSLRERLRGVEQELTTREKKA